MMKLFFVVLAVVLLPISTYARCTFGCSCYDDSNCEYYCDKGICQYQTPLWNKCSSYYIHPRQCGTVSYCDPNLNFTCQLQKNYGERCVYSWSCLSGNCDYRSNTCQSKYEPSNWIFPILMPSAFIFIILILIFTIVMVRRQRLRALAYYRNPYLIIPSGTPYSYQNSCMVGETSPPPYPGAIPTPLPKTYQS